MHAQTSKEHPAAHRNTTASGHQPTHPRPTRIKRTVPPSAPYATWPMIGTHAAALARDLVNVALSQLGVEPEPVEAAVLCASELVANAARHGAGPIWLTVWTGPESVGVHVTDSAPERPVALPPWRPPQELTLDDLDAMDWSEPGVESGRGLAMVVAACKGRCGVAGGRDSKTVWFTVPAPWTAAHDRLAWWTATPPALRVVPPSAHIRGGGR